MKVLTLLCLLLALGAPQELQAQDKPVAYLVEIEGAIGPATADYVERGIEKANQANAQVLILRIDTPGGLDTSMRAINQAILSSAVPVVGFVSPEGARAASAGTYILYATHIAAMAPATSLGAATPVPIGGGMPGTDKPKEEEKDKKAPSKTPQDTMSQKSLNDARAYIRGLAQKRGRNVRWAEEAVTKAETLSAQEALKKNVINLIAKNNEDLLEKINGRKVAMLEGEITLQTQQASIQVVDPGWKFKLLNALTNPNLAYILLMIGFYGLLFEFMNPGYVLPGVVGGICLLLGLYALHILPINYTGAALLLLGIALMVTEAFVPSFGALGIGGVAAFVLGSLLLIDTDVVPGLKISRPLIGTVALTSAAFFIFVVGMALKARRRKVVSGAEEMIGATGTAVEAIQNTGNVFIHGEIWQAEVKQPVSKGQALRVVDREGLVLTVEPISDSTEET